MISSVGENNKNLIFFYIIQLCLVGQIKNVTWYRYAEVIYRDNAMASQREYLLDNQFSQPNPQCLYLPLIMIL